MQDIKYVKPTSVDEAIQVLQKGGARARAFAGGTDLIVQARERKRDVNLFVDHSQIVQLEWRRAGIWGTQDTWGRMLAYRGE